MVALQVLRQLVVSQLLQAGVECRQGPVQQPPAQRDGILPGLVLEEMANIGAGLG